MHGTSKKKPKYRCHPTRNRAVIDVYDHNGNRTRKYLPGKFNSHESTTAYDTLLDELAANGGRLPAPPMSASKISINQLAVRYLAEKVDVEFVDANRRPTSEHECIRMAIRPLVRLFGSSIASEFDAARLEKVRDAMVDGGWMSDAEKERATKNNRPIGWARKNINKAIGRLRAMFRWAVLKKIVTTAVVMDLDCLPPLKAGQGGARETPPVTPVAVEAVDATIPHLPPVVADMVRFQLLTGCRSGEMCAMRSGEIDRSGKVWLYSPASHKTAKLGHRRTIPIGPQVQDILRPYLKDNPAAIVFSPIEQNEKIRAAKRAARKTKVQPSQANRRVENPKRKPGETFNPRAYNHAIARACKRAKVDAWHAHQLRHTAALRISRELGPDAARAVLGHRTMNMTLHYAGVDQEKAVEVAAAMG